MDTPYGGFYVNDEALHFEMLDGEREEQNEDKEIDDLSQDELEEKRKKKRKKKVRCQFCQKQAGNGGPSRLHI